MPSLIKGADDDTQRYSINTLHCFLIEAKKDVLQEKVVDEWSQIRCGIADTSTNGGATI